MLDLEQFRYKPVSRYEIAEETTIKSTPCADQNGPCSSDEKIRQNKITFPQQNCFNYPDVPLSSKEISSKLPDAKVEQFPSLPECKDDKYQSLSQNDTGILSGSSQYSTGTSLSSSKYSAGVHTSLPQYNAGVHTSLPQYNLGTYSGFPHYNPGTSGLPQYNFGTPSGLPQYNFGTSSGLPQHNLGTSSGLPKYNPGTSSGLPQYNPVTFSGLPQYNLETSSGLPQYNPGTPSSLPQYNSGPFSGLNEYNPGPPSSLPQYNTETSVGFPQHNTGESSCLPGNEGTSSGLPQYNLGKYSAGSHQHSSDNTSPTYLPQSNTATFPNLPQFDTRTYNLGHPYQNVSSPHLTNSSSWYSTSQQSRNSGQQHKTDITPDWHFQNDQPSNLQFHNFGPRPNISLGLSQYYSQIDYTQYHLPVSTSSRNDVGHIPENKFSNKSVVNFAQNETSKYFGGQSKTTTCSLSWTFSPSLDACLWEKFLEIEQELASRLKNLDYSQSDVKYISNPIDHAYHPHSLFLQKFLDGEKKILFLGMNPGPWGMCQTGVPFGDIDSCKHFLKVEAEVNQNVAGQHPKRPVEGFSCKRKEVSGSRFWGFFKKICITPETFFKNCFVMNHCPLAFMKMSGKNLAPAEFPVHLKKQVSQLCDAALKQTLELLKVEFIIGVGKFAELRAKSVVKDHDLNIQVKSLMHPSPINPAANKGWDAIAERTLQDFGILDYLRIQNQIFN